MADPTTPSVATPREVLDRYHQAMRDKSADDLADLYAQDAVHEFPFTSPGFPPRFEGRESVRAGYRAAWDASPVHVEEVTNVTIHDTGDPSGVLVAEHTVMVTLPPAPARIAVPGLLILHIRNGLITHARDYMDALAVSATRDRARLGAS